MSSDQFHYSKSTKQPFLYIVNSINQRYDLKKYINNLKQYNSTISFVFSFYDDDTKAIIGLEKEVSREELCQKLHIHNEIIQIPQLSENEFHNFPNEVYVCPIPKCFHSMDKFCSFIENIFHTKDFDVRNNFDFRTVSAQNNCNIAILCQILNNLHNRYQNIYTSKSKFLPIITVTNVPKKFDRRALMDTFQYYLDQKVVTASNEKDLPNNDLYSIRLTFENDKIAQEAHEMFNFSQLDGVEVNTSLYIFRDYLKEMKEWELIVEGIPEDLTSRQLFILFSRFGKVYKAFVKKKPNMPPYGSVQYIDKNDAEKVIKKVDQAKINGNVINIFHKKKIWINNFSSSSMEEAQSYFSDFNPFSMKIINNEQSRPTIILTFRSDSEASEAAEMISEMNSIGMKLIADGEPYKDHEFSEEKSLFISPLPEDYTQLQLIDLCKVYGLLSYAKIANMKNPVLGFVEYDSQKSAEVALKKMEGLAINGNPINVQPYLKRPKRPRD